MNRCVTLIGAVLYTAGEPAADGEPPVCLMTPPYVSMALPGHSSVWLEGEMFNGQCDPVSGAQWQRVAGQSFDLLVAADGPDGSGRYWTITLGWANPGDPDPLGSICLITSTVGWRTLQRFPELPLPWLSDRDRDGFPEAIIWTSFPMREGASLAEYGLMAWVYRFDSTGVFTIDWRLSRALAREIADAYRAPLERAEPQFEKRHDDIQRRRDDIAHHLELFASDQCIVSESGTR